MVRPMRGTSAAVAFTRSPLRGHPAVASLSWAIVSWGCPTEHPPPSTVTIAPPPPSSVASEAPPPPAEEPIPACDIRPARAPVAFVAEGPAALQLLPATDRGLAEVQ